MGGNTYTYDANGNMITRSILRPIPGNLLNKDVYTLAYNAENQLVTVTGPSMNASFTYDGDGKRVKSVINSETILFVGAHYEYNQTTNVVTKNYLAGSSIVATRKYTVPARMTLEYTLGDHLNSASITTDNTGAKVSEIRYKPWGETRYTWRDPNLNTSTPSYALTKYTFTGQYSYMDDPTTTATEGFGLLFYQARFYDPALGVC